MKIGITCYPTYGGSGAMATELGIHLARRGHEIHFVTYAHPFRLQEFQERVYFHAVEMEEYPLFEHPPYSLALAVAMHDTVRHHDLDILHVHYAIPHATSAWLAREMLAGNAAGPGAGRGAKLVTTLHGTDITLVGQHPSFREITRFSIAASDGLTAVSDYLTRETVDAFEIPGERIRVIPNFVDTEVYRRDREPCHRDALARPEEKIVMHISNFRRVKRVPDVVRIFARIRERLPARLVLVGDGPDRPRVEEVARELDVAEDLLVLGKQESVADLLACADLFLLPSKSESFGLVALEAMSCGVPVVASRAGGLPEVVPNGEAGFLEGVGDIEAMAARGIELLADGDLWSRASGAARSVAVERFSAEGIVPVYEEYYGEVLAGGERSG